MILVHATLWVIMLQSHYSLDGYCYDLDHRLIYDIGDTIIIDISWGQIPHFIGRVPSNRVFPMQPHLLLWEGVTPG